MSKKLYCTASQYIKDNYPKYFEIVDLLCMKKFFKPSNKYQITVIIPVADELAKLKKILDKADEESDIQVINIVRSYIIKGCYNSKELWESNKDNVVNSLNKLVEIVGVKGSGSSIDVVVKDGAFSLDPDFRTKQKDQLVVYTMKSGTMPQDGADAKFKQLVKAEKKGGKDHAARKLAFETMLTQYQGSSSANPFLKFMANAIKHSSGLLKEKVLLYLTGCPEVDFLLLVEPYCDSPTYLTDDECSKLFNESTNEVEAKSVYLNTMNAAKDLSEARDEIVAEILESDAQAKVLCSEIKEAYKKLQRHVPENVCSAEGKLKKDEKAFVLANVFEKYHESTPGPDSLQELITSIACVENGKPFCTTDEHDVNFLMAFITSPYFAFFPRSTEKVMEYPGSAFSADDSQDKFRFIKLQANLVNKCLLSHPDDAPVQGGGYHMCPSLADQVRKLIEKHGEGAVRDKLQKWMK